MVCVGRDITPQTPRQCSLHPAELTPLNCKTLAKTAILLEEGGHPGKDLLYLGTLPVFPLPQESAE